MLCPMRPAYTWRHTNLEHNDYTSSLTDLTHSLKILTFGAS